ncbi:MAG TPA: YgiQ family radical SAM protein, partial [Fusibacter sp.]|nr:YgiQ family radical SAM protein [Fusibacter sp.]
MILNDFLPMNREDLKKLEWEGVDFVLVSGDAYVDHPTFGPTIIGRVLLDAGYKVGIIAQPDWNDPESITVLGKPRLGFLVTAGNMDSMVNHYYVSKRRRTTDSFSPGGQMGLRPDRATIVYTNLIRKKFKEDTIIIGGIEA